MNFAVYVKFLWHTLKFCQKLISILTFGVFEPLALVKNGRLGSEKAILGVKSASESINTCVSSYRNSSNFGTHFRVYTERGLSRSIQKCLGRNLRGGVADRGGHMDFHLVFTQLAGGGKLLSSLCDPAYAAAHRQLCPS